jgi:hypothetical protein
MQSKFNIGDKVTITGKIGVYEITAIDHEAMCYKTVDIRTPNKYKDTNWQAAHEDMLKPYTEQDRLIDICCDIRGAEIAGSAIPVSRQDIIDISNAYYHLMTDKITVKEDSSVAQSNQPKHGIQAPEIASQVASTMNQRAQQRGEQQERSMFKCVAMFNAMKGKATLTEHDGWRFMEFLKIARSEIGSKFVLDDYIDGGAYCFLAGECRSQQSNANNQSL